MKESKLCPKCGGTKPTTEFSKHVRARDGLQPHCKSCNHAASAAWYSANREKVNAAAVAWRAASPEKAKAANSAWEAANREKRNAAAAARYVTNADEINDRRAKLRAANPEKFNAAATAWRNVNLEKARAIGVSWQASNREKVRASNTAWAAANPEAKRINRQNRRARKIESGGRLSQGLAERLFKLQRGKCACGCKQSLGTDYHLDHIMPLALGGTNTDENIQLLRSTCNQQKHAKHPVDFMQSRGFLL